MASCHSIDSLESYLWFQVTGEQNETSVLLRHSVDAGAGSERNGSRVERLSRAAPRREKSHLFIQSCGLDWISLIFICGLGGAAQQWERGERPIYLVENHSLHWSSCMASLLIDTFLLLWAWGIRLFLLALEVDRGGRWGVGDSAWRELLLLWPQLCSHRHSGLIRHST